jgi:hypothetical protein
MPFCCFLDVVIDDNLSLASQEMDSNWVSLTSSYILPLKLILSMCHKIRMKQSGEQMSRIIILLFFFLFHKPKESFASFKYLI